MTEPEPTSDRVLCPSYALCTMKRWLLPPHLHGTMKIWLLPPHLHGTMKRWLLPPHLHGTMKIWLLPPHLQQILVLSLGSVCRVTTGPFRPASLPEPTGRSRRSRAGRPSAMRACGTAWTGWRPGMTWTGPTRTSTTRPFKQTPAGPTWWSRTRSRPRSATLDP